MQTEEQPPFFSVVIPTYQRNDLLERCLECLASGKQDEMVLWASAASRSGGLGVAQDAQFRISESHLATCPTYEVIVADDGRTSTAEAMIRERFSWVRWVAGPGTGPAANRNAGAAVARGTWLAFTDDDCLPQPEWLSAYLSEIEQRPELHVLEGMTVPDRPRKTLAEHSPVGIQGGNLWSCNFVIRRTAFEALGGFDPQFRVCMEDNDFALRVREAGMVFPFIEDALVVHPWRPRSLMTDGWKSNRREIEDHLRYKQKHPNAQNITALRMVRLGLRVFWCDVKFVFEERDWQGVSFAAMGLIHILNVALRCGR
jgi:GT2 family glycosyltransferase